MKYTIILAVGASLVAAQNLTGEPDCAVPCLQAAISSVCTPASDQACACASQDAIGQSALTCLLANCETNDLLQAQTAGAQLCIDYSATATAVSSTGAASSGASTSSAATTGGPAASTGTGTNGTTSTATTGAGGAATGTTTSTSSSGGSGAATSASSSTSASASAGAAGAVTAGYAAQVGVMGVFMAGVVALL